MLIIFNLLSTYMFATAANAFSKNTGLLGPFFIECTQL